MSVVVFVFLASVHVEDYGAVPNDGVDDTAEIQDAIDTGEAVHFSNGTYDLSGTLAVDHSHGQKLFGNGANLVQHRDAHGIKVGSDAARFTNVRLQDFHLQYAGPIPSTSTAIILHEAVHTILDQVSAVATHDTGWAVGLDIRADSTGAHWNIVWGGAFIGNRLHALVLKPDHGPPGTGSVNQSGFFGTRFATAGPEAKSVVLFRHNKSTVYKASNGTTFVGISIEGTAEHAVEMRGGSSNYFFGFRLEGSWGQAPVWLGPETRSNLLMTQWRSNNAFVLDEGKYNSVHTSSQEWKSFDGHPELEKLGKGALWYTRDGGNHVPTPFMHLEDASNGPGRVLSLESPTGAEYFIRAGDGATIEAEVTGTGQGRFRGGIAVGNAGPTSFPIFDMDGNLLGDVPFCPSSGLESPF